MYSLIHLYELYSKNFCLNEKPTSCDCKKLQINDAASYHIYEWQINVIYIRHQVKSCVPTIHILYYQCSPNTKLAFTCNNHNIALSNFMITDTSSNDRQTVCSRYNQSLDDKTVVFEKLDKRGKIVRKADFRM